MFNKISLSLYRGVASLAMYGILAWAVWFCVKLIFFSCNSSWIVPTIITREDPRVLAAAERIISLNQSIALLELDKHKSIDEFHAASEHVAQLSMLYPKLTSAIKAEIDQDSRTGETVEALATQASAQDTAAIHNRTAEIDQELAAGLITRDEACIVKSEIAREQSSRLHNQIEDLLVGDSATRKRTQGTEKLALVGKQIDIGAQIVDLRQKMLASQRQVFADDIQLEQERNAMQLIERTPYASEYAKDSRSFAFAPYDTGSIKADQPIYACSAEFILCREVGTVTAVYVNEEKVQNPVSLPVVASSIRGRVIEIHLAEPDVAKSTTLFLNRPMGI
jgi:hypothetical protein